MRLRRLKATGPISGAFENELALEMLKSDRLRVTILIFAFASVLPAILVLAVFAFEDFQRIFHGNFKSFFLIILALLTLGLGWLIVEWLAINRLIKEHRKAYPVSRLCRIGPCLWFTAVRRRQRPGSHRFC